ncbi:MAG: hypothetical protein ACWGNI_04945 [Desulfobacterales bacterium]
MKVIRTGLFSVLKRFPEQKETIIQLFRESDSFQTMCEDYLNCVKALDHWNQSEEDIATTRRNEYSAIIQELEEEILLKLTELNLPISK